MCEHLHGGRMQRQKGSAGAIFFSLQGSSLHIENDIQNKYILKQSEGISVHI